MATVNNYYMLASYTTDFGVDIKNINTKFGNDITRDLLLCLGYENRAVASLCPVTARFTPRHLEAIFPNGAKHKFIIDTSDGDAFTKFVKCLIDAQAVCINLIGEKYRLLTEKDIGKVDYKTTPYTDIPNKASKKTYRYTYSSDVLKTEITLATPIETLPTTLNEAQTACLGTTKTDKGICSGAGLGITPRRFVIQAINEKVIPGIDGKKYGDVSRYAPVALRSPQDLKDCAKKIATAAYCLGYEGESIKNIQDLISTDTPAPTPTP